MLNMYSTRALIFCCLVTLCASFSVSNLKPILETNRNSVATATRRNNVIMQLDETLSRKDLLRKASELAFFSSAASLVSFPKASFAEDEFTTKSGLKVTVLQKGTGEQPNPGELVAIRFKGSYKGTVFDDIFSTPNPYFMRVGGGVLLPGVEEAVPMMRVGDRWALSIPGELGFGVKGKPASPGKPRIPPNAPLDFEVEVVGLPGREVEIIDLLDDPDDMEL